MSASGWYWWWPFPFWTAALPIALALTIGVIVSWQRRPGRRCSVTYLLFAGADYYPYGGWDDLVGEYDTIDEAKAVIDSTINDRVERPAGYTKEARWVSYKYDWGHIVHNNKVILTFTAHDHEPGEWNPYEGDDWT